MKKGDNLGRYYWTCHVDKSEEGGGCDWFEWAEMDDSGENVQPLRNKKRNNGMEIERAEEKEENGREK
jgi:hypothetical protein